MSKGHAARKSSIFVNLVIIFYIILGVNLVIILRQ